MEICRRPIDCKALFLSSSLIIIGVLGYNLIFTKSTPSPKVDNLGGSETAQDLKDYKTQDQLPSCDKGGHKERSIVNQPNHLKHWNDLYKIKK